jgi:hypothetical protein
MNRPPPLNVIPLGNDWLATNGELTPDGKLRFPEDDPGEELFGNNSAPPIGPPPQPSAPPTAS